MPETNGQVRVGTITLTVQYTADGRFQVQLGHEGLSGGWQAVEDAVIAALPTVHQKARSAQQAPLITVPKGPLKPPGRA